MLVPIGKKGFILTEGESEPYIKVQDDFINTGGYLVLVSATPDFVNGHDYWVSQEDLEQFFREAQWEINWAEE